MLACFRQAVVRRSRRQGRSTGSSRPSGRRGAVEALEDRRLLAPLPYGADADDTAEFMLGDVLVSVVLMESDGSIDTSSEDWSESSIQEVRGKIEEGMQWWTDMLDRQDTVHRLNFFFDYTYADTPVATGYEPIARSSNYFTEWVDDFLDLAGHNTAAGYSDDLRAFNHAQRLAHGTHWAFTMFVVNDQNDSDGRFAPGGFSRAFAFAGGRALISPAGRPASTFAHETGHIFWARDEYMGGGSYTDRRGYYDTQNWNAFDNPEPGFVQVDSIMGAGDQVTNAYENYTSSTSSLEMIGWRDSDADGVFDVLDVPHRLEGAGRYDASSGEFSFVGSAHVDTLPNLNSSGLQNDITLNRISHVQYRLDGGSWMTAVSVDDYSATLDLSLTLPEGTSEIEIRAIDFETGIVSNSFLGNVQHPTSTTDSGISGFVWNDQDADGRWSGDEVPLADRWVRLVDDQGQELDSTKSFDPNPYFPGTSISEASADVTFTAIGDEADGRVVSWDSTFASTGDRVFANYWIGGGGWSPLWSTDSRRLRMDFTDPVSFVALDAIGDDDHDFARLEIFDQQDNLLARYTTSELSAGQVERMSLGRPDADIAYAVARAHRDSGVQFDNLTFGHDSRARTDDDGLYQLRHLPPGEYAVRIVEWDDWETSGPVTQEPVVVNQSPTPGVNFGQVYVGTLWKNPIRPLDVNDDGSVTPTDALVVINRINREPGVTVVLPTITVPPERFYDVNGDGLVTPSDVLRIINHLNRQARSESESEAQSVSDAEGELIVGGGEPSSAEGEQDQWERSAGDQACGLASDGVNPVGWDPRDPRWRRERSMGQVEEEAGEPAMPAAVDALSFLNGEGNFSQRRFY